ncbi:MAG: hypothetical protein IOD05_01520 [Rhodobacter sp.]|jgi:acyl carrier protein|nr:hypothetical protein [Rhodobacter sp.]
MKELEMVRLALKEECNIDPATVNASSHLLNDLDIDSLDLLNATFRIEKMSGVKIPVRDWLTEEYGDAPPTVSKFLVSEIAAFLARGVA